MLDIKVKGQCVHSKLTGSAEELMQELVMLNVAVITDIVQNMDLKPNKSTLMAKLQMADTINACAKNGYNKTNNSKRFNKGCLGIRHGRDTNGTNGYARNNR